MISPGPIGYTRWMDTTNNRKRFAYIVWVDCATADEAEQVMGERLGPDEDYGFDYSLTYERRA